MSRRVFNISPLAHLLHLEDAPFNAQYVAAQWPVKNLRVSSNRIESRWDHELYRTFASGDVIQSIPLFRKADGTYALLTLTETDLCQIRTGTGETYSYLTDTYTTGHITGITDDAVTGSGDSWTSSGLNPGDKFILEDDLTPKVEPDTTWATIKTVTDNAIVLEANYDTYGGTEGDFSATPKHYRARKVYSCPTNERWQYATVGEKFCFTNGSGNVHYWAGDEPEGSEPPAANFATDLNTTYAVQARYCVPYANRLILADLYNESTSARDSWLVRTSAEGDPTKFYGDAGITTAANYPFIDTEEPITGLATVGGQLVVFKRTMYTLGRRSGTATNPLTFQGGEKKGIGLHAPYSLVHYAGSCAWLGVDDFYVMNGDVPVSIGGPIRKRFFDMVSNDDQVRVYGVNDIRHSEIIWVAMTSTGQVAFVWNYQENTGPWTVYEFDSSLTGLGFVGG